MNIKKLFSILDGCDVHFDVNRFNEVTNNVPTVIEKFYRSDRRDLEELSIAGGFTPFAQVTNENNKLNFIKACCTLSVKEAIELAFDNQFRSSFSDEYGRFFISTGINDCHKTDNEYVVELKMKFYKVVDKAGGPLCIGISQNDWEKPIRAIMLNREEVIFIDPIPFEFIHKKVQL